MASDWPDLISRDELLGGLPARRASTLLFAIESRTAHLVARSRQAMATFPTEKTAEERERAFLDALAQGRDPPLQPTIQDLERYAPEWESLVPLDAGIRAAVGRMIGEKYVIRKQAVPRLRRALGLDDADVQQAFERLHGRPLSSIYADRVPWRERWRWLRSRGARRLESLPPFWTAFALTLTETVGAGILALPIAFATVGVLPGVLTLVVLGLVNVLTIAAMAEAVARNGSVRYGHAYFGRLVSDYLGRAGALVLTPAIVTIIAIATLAYYVGLSSTLADASPVPAAIWAALLFFCALAMLRRETLDATVASALVVGFTTISLIVVLSLLALPHVTESNLRYAAVPFWRGESFEPAILELIFGVVLLAFFGHTSVANSAAVVLRRDSSARTLIWGAVAAQLAALALYCVWVIAVNGAVGPTALAGETSTALVPLADEVGPGIRVLGIIFVVLAMGMASIHMALGLCNQVREWLPANHEPAGSRGRLASFAASDRGRFVLGIAPTATIFVFVEWLFLADRASFAGLLGFLGTITAPVVGGIFAMLMLLAGRRKGDCTVGMAWRFLGHPVVVVGVYLLFLAGIALHGLVIWEETYQRAVALLVTGVTLIVTAVVVRQGAFASRAVVELRVVHDVGERAVINLTASGQPVRTDATLIWSDGHRNTLVTGDNARSSVPLQAAEIILPTMPARELKVWAHHATPDGTWQALPVHLEIQNGNTRETFDQGQSAGQVVVPVGADTHRLEITVAR